MMSLLFHIRCTLLFFVLVQSVSLYKIYTYDDNQPNSLSASFNDALNPSIESNIMGYDDYLNNWKSNLKRSALLLPQRRNNRPHWNPLVAAYKRCGELVSSVERESCFKEAIQMLFVHKLRK